MGIPAYLMLIIGMVILLIIVCIVYCRVYKRSINRALEEGTRDNKPMPSPFHVLIGVTIIFLLFVIFMSYLIGFGMGYRSLDNEQQIDVTSYYAEVKEVGKEPTTGELTITVNGIELNDKSHRGEYTYLLYEGMNIEWNNQAISITDLESGDLVCITLLTDALGVEDIFKIQLIDDEL